MGRFRADLAGGFLEFRVPVDVAAACSKPSPWRTRRCIEALVPFRRRGGRGGLLPASCTLRSAIRPSS
jgi:hypothetical protein